MYRIAGACLKAPATLVDNSTHCFTALAKLAMAHPPCVRRWTALRLTSTPCMLGLAQTAR
jgi:hypothetical protein